MRFEQLQFLREIARTGSITAAADNLFVSQQAVSRSIKQLEDELGTTLIVRQKNGVVLTNAGMEALMVGNHILNAREYLLHNMKLDTEFVPVPERNICSFCSNSPFLSILAPLAAAQSELRVSTVQQVELSREVLEHLLAGNEKLGLVTVMTYNWEKLEKELSDMEQLSVHILEHDRIVCVKAKRHFTWEQNHITWNEFCLRQKSVYNVELLNVEETDDFLSVPNDIALHLNLMEYTGILTLMPDLVYRRFCSDKKYLSVILEEVPPANMVYQPMMHLAVCRKENEKELKPLIQQIRRTLHKR